MINRLITTGSIRSLSRCTEALASRGVSSSAGTVQSSRQLSIIRSVSAINFSSTTSSHTDRNYSIRQFSDSHDDFSPQKKTDISSESEESTILDLIDSHVKANRVMLYMKGSPNQPMCGFSATVVQILKNSGADFASVNVLDYPEVREGVKKYAQWPTIPQLYVDGEFVGGCDIIKDMDDSGELKELLKVDEGEKKE